MSGGMVAVHDWTTRMAKAVQLSYPIPASILTTAPLHLSRSAASRSLTAPFPLTTIPHHHPCHDVLTQLHTLARATGRGSDARTHRHAPCMGCSPDSAHRRATTRILGCRATPHRLAVLCSGPQLHFYPPFLPTPAHIPDGVREHLRHRIQPFPFPTPQLAKAALRPLWRVVQPRCKPPRRVYHAPHRQPRPGLHLRAEGGVPRLVLAMLRRVQARARSPTGHGLFHGAPCPSRITSRLALPLPRSRRGGPRGLDSPGPLAGGLPDVGE